MFERNDLTEVLQSIQLNKLRLNKDKRHLKAFEAFFINDKSSQVVLSL